LHERDEKNLNIFYEQRDKYFEHYRHSRNTARFSSKIGKDEPVYDYISVLAAPFYFWNTKNIIQADPTEETDSMEKCAKIHKKEFSLTGIMYPEIISKNGVDTIFYAKKEHKIYV
jgi:hypothetical protein